MLKENYRDRWYCSWNNTRSETKSSCYLPSTLEWRTTKQEVALRTEIGKRKDGRMQQGRENLIRKLTTTGRLGMGKTSVIGRDTSFKLSYLKRETGEYLENVVRRPRTTLTRKMEFESLLSNISKSFNVKNVYKTRYTTSRGGDTRSQRREGFVVNRTWSDVCNRRWQWIRRPMFGVLSCLLHELPFKDTKRRDCNEVDEVRSMTAAVVERKSVKSRAARDEWGINSLFSVWESQRDWRWQREERFVPAVCECVLVASLPVCERGKESVCVRR